MGSWEPHKVQQGPVQSAALRSGQPQNINTGWGMQGEGLGGTGV